MENHQLERLQRKNIVNQQNLFIVFAPGLGGNHLKNILSLDSKFCNEFDLNEYFQTQTNDLSKKNAHFSPVLNLNSDTIAENLEFLIANKNNIFCCHIAEYLWFLDSEYNKYFNNRQFICMNMPINNNLPGDRLMEFSPWMNNRYIFHEFATLYSSRYLSKLFDETDWFYTSADLLFGDNINLVIDDLTQQGLALSIDRKVAQKLHNAWLSNIIKKG